MAMGMMSPEANSGMTSQGIPTVLKMRSRPKCNAVRGCKDKALILTFDLPQGARRICARHLARYRRTGDLGPAGSTYGKGTRTDRLAPLRKLFAQAVTKIGFDWAVLPGDRQGVVRLVRRINSKDLMKIATPQLWAFKRRGWISLTDFSDAHTRLASVLRKGADELV